MMNDETVKKPSLKGISDIGYLGKYSKDEDIANGYCSSEYTEKEKAEKETMVEDLSEGQEEYTD